MDSTINRTIGSTISSPAEQTEGPIARAIEERTSKLPFDTFLWMAIGAMAGSAILQATGRQHVSLFVGQWVPAVLLFGVYNKLVKQLGSDSMSRGYSSAY